MDSSRDSEFDARLARMEAAVLGLQRSLDALIAERRPAHSRERTADPLREQVERSYAAEAAASSRASSFPDPPIAPRRRATTSDGIDGGLSSWFTSRDPEWWLSRVGIGFLVLGVLLLYGYAIDKGWITPTIRVFAGVTVGALLFWAATRVRSHKEAAGRADLGFRELLLGGGLAIWYVTAYAAAVWYQLIPIPAARLVFFLLGLVSTWIALQERREIFALLAVATGFATPFILPAPVQSMTELSLYLGAVTAMGLIIYLMRGWQSILWITFVAFWVNVATQTADARASTVVLGSFDLTMLLIAAAAAFTRVPSLRRRLVLLGSPRYTSAPVTSGSKRLMEAMDSLSKALGGGKSAPDSLIVWVLILMSVALAIGGLGQIWPKLPDEIWGVVSVVLGVGALAFSRRAAQPDAEMAHVALTAAVYWILIGVARIAPTPEYIPACALLAALVVNSVKRQLAGPRALAKLTIGLALMAIAGYELSSAHTGLVHLRWVVSEIVTLGAAAFIARELIAEPADEMQGMVLAAASYLTALIVVWSALYPVWAPLVTTSYAILGAVLLILSRREGARPLLKYLGGVTMLIVVGRLLLVDLSSVEAIWRVLLFLVIGAVFLYTGYRMQPRKT